MQVALPVQPATGSIWIADGVEDGGAAALAAYLADQGTLRYIAADPGDRLTGWLDAEVVGQLLG